MRIMIAAVGKARSGANTELTLDYLQRAQAVGRNIGFSGPDIVEIDPPRQLTGVKRQTREGELLLQSIPDRARIIVLDQGGGNLSSEDIAAMLGGFRDQGAPETAFLIGGADGHGAGVKARASKILSFGAATWPHMLVRVMLTEQLYRAMTILSGHPYHRS